MLEKKYPKSYELTTVLLYRKNNTLVTLNNGCQNLLILTPASGFIIVENLSGFLLSFSSSTMTASVLDYELTSFSPEFLLTVPC